MSGVVGRGRHYLVRDGHTIVPVGAHFVPPEGPDWPWRTGAASFDRAFGAMAEAGLDTVRIDLLWSAIEPEAGRYDLDHLAVLDEIVEAARRHGLLLHPVLFVGGEVGDAYWDIQWRDGRHPHRDPELLAHQVAHARELGGRWRADPTILAWDLADEPPAWLFRDTTDDEARAWASALCDVLRSVDPDHLVTIGTASQEIGVGPFRADVVAGDLDFATVHPYPTYEPTLYPDGLLSPRLTHAAAFETALAAGAGRPVMLHEYGVSSAQFDPELAAAYDRLLAWSSFGRGAIGFLAWCWTDAEPAAYRRAPYVRQPHETQFGVTDHRGDLRPRGRVLTEMAAVMKTLADDLDDLAGDGPVGRAAIPVPHEYVRAYDPDAYGLGDAPAGPYEPAERVWDSERDHRPLVAAWLNAFVLAARAGVSVAFERESLDDGWPEIPLVLVPAPLTSTSSSLLHVRTSFWGGAGAHFARGGSAWLSMSGDAALPGMGAVAGCHLADRAPADRPGVLRFVRGWGPFGAGDELILLDGDGSLATRWARLAMDDGEVVATDADGEPGLVVARRGAGLVVTCAAPVELLLSARPNAHGSLDRSWGLYAGLLAEAGIREPASVDHPDVTCSTLRGRRGGLATVTNHGEAGLQVHLRLPSEARRIRRFGPTGIEPLGEGDVVDGALVVGLELAGYGFAVIGWDGRP
jgi:hypothetical protein